MPPDSKDALVDGLLARVEVEIMAAAALGRKEFSVPVEDSYVDAVQHVISTYQIVGWQVIHREPKDGGHYLDFVRL